ncbi:pentapeptide repeat-containing protein [Streptomyces asoensis]|uniref:pentapeptide repeat-containing protein n=1 Tax=Streptomyces asoensis TaxID=249586 RepID=UPI0033C82A00
MFFKWIWPLFWWTPLDEALWNGLTEGEKATSLGQWRLAFVQALAAVGALAALSYTARTYALSRRGQFTERFAKGLERLDSDDELYLRIGGIHALEHVSFDSAAHHDNVVEVLTDFIFSRTSERKGAIRWSIAWAPRPVGRQRIASDVQAALSALGRRRRPRRNRLDFKGFDLRDADLTSLDLKRADLSAAVLRRSFLTKARLQRSNLVRAELHYARLSEARLSWANLTEARLPRASLIKARMRWARLPEARLQRANLTQARLEFVQLSDSRLDHADLTKARMQFADLRGAQLQHSGLSEARLTFADLRGANLSNATGVTASQLRWARVDHRTTLPAHLIWDGLYWTTVRDRGTLP